MRAGDQSWELASDEAAPGAARHLVSDAMEGLPEECLEIASLLVSELVTNAVLHGSAPVGLTVTRDAGTLEVSVHDGDTTPPALIRAPVAAEQGRGLQIVDALADHWGTEVFENRPGKRVWFRMSLP